MNWAIVIEGKSRNDPTLKGGAPESEEAIDMSGAKFAGEFEDRIRLINDILRLTDRLAKQLEANVGHDEFVPTAIEFARINAEAPASITLLAREGNLAQAHVLLRWHLEMSHLLWYLWRKPDELQKWRAGNWIRPKEIGKSLDARERKAMRGAYDDWSNAVHCNTEFIENHAVIAKVTPKTEVQMMIVGAVLMDVAFIGQMTNELLVETLPSEVAQLLIEENCKTGQEFQRVLDEQLATEGRLMGEE
jgi:hypothetical protein